MEIKPRILLLLLCCLSAVVSASASHIAGGDMTYTYLGDSLSFHRYRVTLTIYEDCTLGIPKVIAQDNPAFLAVYPGVTPFQLIRTDSVLYSSSTLFDRMINSSCGTSKVPGCMLKKTFIMHYALPSNSNGYFIVYDRCCRNGNVTNVTASDRMGITLYCTIPPAPLHNTSAVFRNDPVQNAGLNKSFYIDFSATDADGDSLSYELSPALNGADQSDVKPWPPYAPPFDAATYISPFTFDNPVASNSPVHLDPNTGMLTGIATQAGMYLLAVSCSEWRGGVLINMVRREMELTVATPSAPGPYKPNAGGDLMLIAGDKHQFHATGANIYTWSPGTYLDNANIPDPTGIFPDRGTFKYTLHGISDSGCVGDDEITVTVLDASSFVVPNAFSPNGDGLNDYLQPYPVGNSTLTDFRIFNRLGNLVFQAGNLAAASWDGKYKGKQQDLGVYVWELKFTDNTNRSRLIKGNVTLIR
jgi:gliding motility-associated-like protein